MGEQTKRKDVQWIRKGEKERIKKERGSKHERMRGNRIQIEREKERERERERERDKGERETKKKRFSRHSEGRSPTVREEKLIHTSRAKRGYQNLGVSSNSTR